MLNGDDELAVHRLLLNCGRLVDHARQMWLAEAVRGLLAEASMLHFHVHRDDGPDVTFVATLYPAGGGPVASATAPDLETALKRLCGREDRKICSGCHADKPLCEYTTSRQEPDGRHHACKACERQRQAAYYRRKKQAREGGATARPAPAAPAPRGRRQS
jgi:hypothetical protein